jgi:hypothetical protein
MKEIIIKFRVIRIEWISREKKKREREIFILNEQYKL